jgi:nicotinamidase-related amidase
LVTFSIASQNLRVLRGFAGLAEILSDHDGSRSATPMRIAAIALLAALFLPLAASAQTVIDDWSTATPPPAPPLKDVRIDPQKTALLVADFNRKSCTPEGRPRCAAALPKLRAFLAVARAKGMLVVHFYNGQMTAADLAVAPAPGEPVMQAPINKFFGNDLAKTLRDRGIDTIVLSGTSANGAVLFTTAGAVLLGFKVVVPVDGMPADGLYQEQFVAWELAKAPNLSDGTTLTRWDKISF